MYEIFPGCKLWQGGVDALGGGYFHGSSGNHGDFAQKTGSTAFSGKGRYHPGAFVGKES